MSSEININYVADLARLELSPEQAEKLQKEIVNNYNGYKQAIVRAYSNAAERS